MESSYYVARTWAIGLPGNEQLFSNKALESIWNGTTQIKLISEKETENNIPKMASLMPEIDLKTQYFIGDHIVKNCVGGVNIFMTTELYKKLKLDHTALHTKYWDWSMCNAVSKNNSSIIALKDSVIQHIGFDGMHSKFNVKQFDFAYDFVYDYDKNFYLLPSIDSPGFNKNKIEGSLETKMKVSLADKNIIGFNSNGEMKTKITINEDPKNLHKYRDFQGLFIKKSEINKVNGLPRR